jgi:hypothetical protein
MLKKHKTTLLQILVILSSVSPLKGQSATMAQKNLGGGDNFPFKLDQPQSQERKAEQEYKNIRVLNGKPAAKLMNTMFFMRYSLGVTCNFCHVGTQYEKDDKPAKARAREMIRMVMDLNEKNFAGNSRVNCNTCHRGTRTPVNQILPVRGTVQSMLGGRPSFREDRAPALPSVDEVLNKFIEALGGRDSLAKIKNAVLKGNMVTAEGLIAPFEEYHEYPNKSLSVRHLGTDIGDFSDGFDGTIGWSKDNRGVNEKTGERLSQAQMDAEFSGFLRLKEFYSSLAVTARERMESESAYVLEGKSVITGRSERLYFGAQSGLLLRRSVATEGIFGSFSSDTYYENYVLVDGVKLPILLSEFTPDFGTIRKIRDVEFNATIDGEKFRKPLK